MPYIPKFQPLAEGLAPKLGYRFIRYVDHGAFKETYEAEDANGQKVALKIMDPLRCDLSRNEREIDSMKRCDHPGIGRLIANGKTIDGTGQSYYYSVEEYFDGGSLGNKLKDGPIALDRAIGYGCYLARAIEYLVPLDIVHRDIKPENIMFRKDSHLPILVDFGLVRDLSKTSLTHSWQPCGPCTPLYAAPEQLNNDKALIDWRTDQFSLGIVLCFCMTQMHPYQQSKGSSNGAIIDSVGNRNGTAAWFIELARKNQMEFLVKMLHPWPNRRFTCPSDMVNAIEARRGG